MTSLLVLGGARSGKSRYAESLAKGQKYYIATGQAFDDEMQERITAHRTQRGGGWNTLEAPLHVVDTLREIDGKGRFILIDCLTIWIGNLMHEKLDVLAEVERLCAALAKAKAHVAVVSNEVGLGIVPDNAMARAFRDLQGFANQRMARAADEVVFIAAGVPLVLKKSRRAARQGQIAKSSRIRKT
jgi:adenosylcobinamide kinase / adenosylcobinamide-phosphate guanylyltransferase